MPIPLASDQRVIAGGEDSQPDEEGEAMTGGSKPEGRKSGGGRFERVTVNLAPLSSSALEHASSITGDSKTDTINRALQIYAMLADAVDNGGAVLLRYPDGEVERQRLFPERFDRMTTRG